MPGPGHGSPDRAELAARAVTLRAALASLGRSKDVRFGDRRRSWTPRCADHKFLIMPQCTPSAGITLCGICAKSEQLLAILLVFTELPQLRRIAAVNAVGAHTMTSRTGTARSTTNTQGARERFSPDGVLRSSLAE